MKRRKLKFVHLHAKHLKNEMVNVSFNTSGCVTKLILQS